MFDPLRTDFECVSQIEGVILSGVCPRFCFTAFSTASQFDSDSLTQNDTGRRSRTRRAKRSRGILADFAHLTHWSVTKNTENQPLAVTEQI